MFKVIVVFYIMQLYNAYAILLFLEFDSEIKKNEFNIYFK